MKKAICCLLMLSGCSAEYWANAYKPMTQVRFSKGLGGVYVSVKNTKDVNVDVGEIKWDSEGGINVGYLKFIDMASPVLDAQTRQQEALVQTMQTQVDYQRQLGQNLAMVIAAGGDAVARFVKTLPEFSGTIDLGRFGRGAVGISSSSSADIVSLLERLDVIEKKLSKIDD